MKLRPLQIVGLVALVVFGAILVTTLMKGRRDPDLLPSGVRISELPRVGDQIPPAAPPLPGGSAESLADPLSAGSQDAKDDLYCSGVVFAEHQTKPEEALTPEAQERRDAVIRLAEAGVAKLKAELGYADATTADIADAHAAAAARDYDAGSLRISFADCMARWKALP